jgi:hypothetical protein
VKRLVVRDEDASCRGDRDERREQPEDEPQKPAATGLTDCWRATA